MIVTQNASISASLTASPDSLGFAAGGGQDDIQITSNINWTVVRAGSAPWLTVTPTTGSGNSTVHVTTAPHTGVTARRDTLTLSGGGLTRRIIVMQEAAPSVLTVATDSVGFVFAGGLDSIPVASNVDWTVARTGNAPWLTVAPLSGSGNDTLRLTAAPHTGVTVRRDTLTLSGGGLTRRVVVTQETAPPSLTVATDSLGIAYGGGRYSLQVVSNTNWTVDAATSWLTVSAASGSGDSTLVLTAEVHTDTLARRDTLVFAGGGLVRRVAVVQNGFPQVVAGPSQPVDRRGAIDIVLVNIPVEQIRSASFAVNLPAGFTLDPEATAPTAGLQPAFELEIIPGIANVWLLTLRPGTSPPAAVASRQSLLQLAYTVNGTVANGSYEARLDNVSLALGSGEVIARNDIRAAITVSGMSGTAPVDAADIRYALGLLTVNTPAAERITVYSLSGAVMYRAQKTASPATFDLSGLPKGVFIIRGSSGWTEKVIK